MIMDSVATLKSLHVQAPNIDSVSPRFGPLEGGTSVTIRGQLLGNATKVPSVYLGIYSQNVTEQ